MLGREQLFETFVEMVRRASTELPADVIESLERGQQQEENGGLAQKALGTILQNVNMARDASAPICQDTGTPVVWIHHPAGMSPRVLEETLVEAVQEATKRSYLRPNAVETLSGKNTGTGAGRGIPYVHTHEWDRPEVEVRMLLKGGGSENVGAQYKLPDNRLHAGRDLDGVRKVLLDAVVQAQGKGCAPGILGVCVGGDRVSGFSESKRQLLRPIADRNSNPELDALEQRVMQEANTLNIGPMGFGGSTTLLGVKIGHLDRLPACYFVSISYLCWAARKAGVSISEGGEVTWLS